MANILVTGSTGGLGCQTLDFLLERVPAAQLAALARDPAKLADFAARGVDVRQGDYLDRASLEAAFQGIDRLFFISAPSFTDMVAQHADIVRRFLAASAEGWRDYLTGDPAPGDALMLQANPGMNAALLAYGRGVLKSQGIVMGGDAAKLGVGAMTDARWAAFFQSMVAAGLYPADLDYHQAYTLQFVGGR